MITGTSTHSGPEMTPIVLEGARRMADVIRAYQLLPRLIARAVQQAEANVTPARVWAAVGQERGISRNSRYLMKDGSVPTRSWKATRTSCEQWDLSIRTWQFSISKSPMPHHLPRA